LGASISSEAKNFKEHTGKINKIEEFKLKHINNIDDFKIISSDFKATIFHTYEYWCDPCDRSMDLISSIDKEKSDVEIIYVIAVPVNRSILKKTRKKLDSFSIDYSDVMTSKNNEFHKKLGMTGVPYTLIANKDGVIKTRKFGFLHQQDHWNDFLKHLHQEYDVDISFK